MKQAISYSDHPAIRGVPNRKKYTVLYLCCLLLAAGFVSAIYLLQWETRVNWEYMLTAIVLCAVFGLYFIFLAKEKLPAYYDQNKISGYLDGPVRMNLPGVNINNRNWPHIVRVIRAWCMCTIVFYPALTLLMIGVLPEFWLLFEKYILLTVILGGMFIPVVIVGKKYE